MSHRVPPEDSWSTPHKIPLVEPCDVEDAEHPATRAAPIAGALGKPLRHQDILARPCRAMTDLAPSGYDLSNVEGDAGIGNPGNPTICLGRLRTARRTPLGRSGRPATDDEVTACRLRAAELPRLPDPPAFVTEA